MFNWTTSNLKYEIKWIIKATQVPFHSYDGGVTKLTLFKYTKPVSEASCGESRCFHCKVAKLCEIFSQLWQLCGGKYGNAIILGLHIESLENLLTGCYYEKGIDQVASYYCCGGCVSNI